jgi:hypothetical protein
LLGSVIPLVPVSLPYLALVLLAFKRLVLSALTVAAALFISPAEVTFPKFIVSPISQRVAKEDWHRFAADHPAQTALTGLILLAAALFAAWQWDSDVREDVVSDVDKTPQIRRPVSRWLPQIPVPMESGDDEQNLDPLPDPDVTKIARKHKVTVRAVERWANGRVWLRTRTLGMIIVLLIPSVFYLAYLYPFPRSKAYYEATFRTPWLPAETISLRSGGKVVGYILTSDSNWVVILTDNSRTIRYVAAGDVVARVICDASHQTVLATASRPLFPLLKPAPSSVVPCS